MIRHEAVGEQADRIFRKKDKRLSRKGRRADALALRAEERRDKLRKATGSRKQAGIRGYLNGGTRLAQPVTV